MYFTLKYQIVMNCSILFFTIALCRVQCSTRARKRLFNAPDDENCCQNASPCIIVLFVNRVYRIQCKKFPKVPPFQRQTLRYVSTSGHAFVYFFIPGTSTVLYSTLLYSIILHCTMLYCYLLYCTVLYSTVIQCIVLYLNLLRPTLVHQKILHCTVLYFIALHFYANFIYSSYISHRDVKTERQNEMTTMEAK